MRRRLSAGAFTSGLALLLASGLAGGCAHVVRSQVPQSQRAEWTVYRTEVEPILLRLLGPTKGLVAECEAAVGSAPAPEFGIDVGSALRPCAQGNLSDARQEVHRQIDRISTNEGRLGS